MNQCFCSKCRRTLRSEWLKCTARPIRSGLIRRTDGLTALHVLVCMLTCTCNSTNVFVLSAGERFEAKHLAPSLARSAQQITQRPGITCNSELQRYPNTTARNNVQLCNSTQNTPNEIINRRSGSEPAGHPQTRYSPPART